jgi:hypothetical protein
MGQQDQEIADAHAASVEVPRAGLGAPGRNQPHIVHAGFHDRRRLRVGRDEANGPVALATSVTSKVREHQPPSTSRPAGPTVSSSDQVAPPSPEISTTKVSWYGLPPAMVENQRR